MLADTFNNHFEPDILRSARRVLEAAGRTVKVARPLADDPEPQRPLCCGRTWLAVGRVDRARAEMQRTLAALSHPDVAGLPLIGLEPSCLFTFRDEALALGLGEAASALAARSLLFEEYLVRERAAGRLDLPLEAQSDRTLHLHGHCHQKAFGTMGAVAETLGMLPGVQVQIIESGCCGMAGAFGYQAETQTVSRAMASLDLLPALEKLPGEAIVVADGTSCRHQIHDLAGRRALHVAEVLDRALARQAAGEPIP